ncbi:ornithine cyclodeaminase family protein [Marinomonas sp. THO17]|uniref:ornithine cyclodeaminase family protein n=1 Tax=Marinomonas sp. THO17 TaxID=3149048 RepID=UPI00336C2CA2
MIFLSKKEILKVLENIDIFNCIEEGFIAFSKGEALIPPVAGMEFASPPGEVHIKYGAINNHSEYVIKIASGFYENPKIGMPSSNGVMMVFSKVTGELLSVLHDEGYLTDIRTAIAGAISARLLAPKHIKKIGIIGTGTQARLQLSYLKYITKCRDVVIYGRRKDACHSFHKDMAAEGFNINIAHSISELAVSCNLIVTTTTSRDALLMAKDIQLGTHITAVGADTPGKQELDPKLFAKADRVVADSIGQCVERGECAIGIHKGYLHKQQIVELGELLEKNNTSREETDITIADLTGVAVQDIQIATAVYHNSL